MIELLASASPPPTNYQIVMAVVFGLLVLICTGIFDKDYWK